MARVPRITRQGRANIVSSSGFDRQHNATLVRQRPTQNNDALIDQPVHEGRMRSPARLLL
jgi:hypothetical protein